MAKAVSTLKAKSRLMLGGYVTANVRAALAARNMTKKDLAEAMGAPPPTVYGILGDPNRIKVNHVEIFARVLGVPVEELLCRPKNVR